MKQRIQILLLSFLIFTNYTFAEGILSLHESSELTILGSTNLITFSLNQKGEEILNRSHKYKLTKVQNKYFSSLKKITLDVAKFKSNNPIAESEFYKMMEIERFPDLTVELLYYERKKGTDTGKGGTAKLNITIKGISNTYEINVDSNINRNRITLKGEKELSIKDFGIEPPVAMFGLIRVNEWIKINFDLVCDLK